LADGVQKVNEEFLRRQLERFTTLSDSNSMAASELDRLTMELRMLEQERAAREARRDGTLYSIEVATIAAPFSGLIVERNAELGEFARAGEPVLRIVNTEALEVRASAPVSVARHVRPGQKILLESGENRVEATVKTLIPSGDDRSRMVEVRVRIPAGDWIIGEAVRVDLPNGTALTQLAVSRDALVLRDREIYVFKIMENATAKRISVRPGNGAGDTITIEGDLIIGDEVVIRGAETLRDGQAVRILGGSTAAHMTGKTVDKG
jgi:RND family efflux transporter MFP subunit